MNYNASTDFGLLNANVRCLGQIISHSLTLKKMTILS